MSSLLSSIETVPVDSLITHPNNARRGDVNVIAESLQENAQYSPLVVQTSTRYVLSGNHTLMAARQLEWENVDVVLVDVDDERALKIMLSANRTSDVATYDDDALLLLLERLDGNYTGTGYQPEDFEELAMLLGGEESDTPPSLDDLEDKLGGHDEQDLWPTLRFKVPPNVRDDFYDLTNNCTNPNDDNIRFMHLIQKLRANA
jgi:ParB/Sulfiredoxin domain